MYQHDDQTRRERRPPDGPGRILPKDRAVYALAHIESVLTASAADSPVDRSRMRAALEIPLADTEQERRRWFALGWLAWLEGDFASARSWFERGDGARFTYWLDRVRLLLGESEAIAHYEQALRSFQGAPQATAWFVDLLWRAGRHDRAAQVWKSLRLNKRIQACEEFGLLDARAAIAQGDLATAERSLREACPSGSVQTAERGLLLGWLLLAKEKKEEGKDQLEAAMAQYSEKASRWWRTIAAREGLGWEQLLALPLSPGGRAWIEAQHRRAIDASPDQYLELVSRAGELPPLAPFAHYVRAGLGREECGNLLTALPGGFLAPRCRLWGTVARFCRREASPTEMLDALQRATQAGYAPPGLEELTGIAQALSELNADPGRLWRGGTRNARRAALELELRSGSEPRTFPILIAWSRELIEDAPLRERLGHALLRFLLTSGDGPGRCPPNEILDAATGLLGESSLVQLVSQIHHATPSPDNTPATPSSRLASVWRWAVELSRGQAGGSRSDSIEDSPTRQESGLARSLELYDSLLRNGSPLRALEPSPGWKALSQPPGFVIAALLAAPDLSRWNAALSAWLEQWPDCAALEPLRQRIGLSQPHAETANVPGGVDAVSWFLHQAGISLSRNDAGAALAWVRRAQAQGLDSLDESRRRVVEATLPDLERRALSQRLAEIARLDDSIPTTSASLFVEFTDLLQQHPDGPSILAEPNLTHAREQLDSLAARSDLPARLAHHLALVYYRAARHLDEGGQVERACPLWSRSWRCWLQWANGEADARAEPLFDHLLTLHRGALEGLLARGDISKTRLIWNLVQSNLLGLLEGGDPRIGALIRPRLQRFREDLTTEFLLDTQDAMRHGGIPEGWKADYDLGLSRLRRLLSLDRDNPRLLVAVVEIAADWFLDLYDLGDTGRLRQEVDRFTPFAMQLTRLGARHESGAAEELKSRTALSEFYKFRAFVTDDPERKRTLYREALEMNPANDNVRDLLGGLDEGAS